MWHLQILSCLELICNRKVNQSESHLCFYVKYVKILDYTQYLRTIYCILKRVQNTVLNPCFFTFNRTLNPAPHSLLNYVYTLFSSLIKFYTICHVNVAHSMNPYTCLIFVHAELQRAETSSLQMVSGN